MSFSSRMTISRIFASVTSPCCSLVAVESLALFHNKPMVEFKMPVMIEDMVQTRDFETVLVYFT